MVYCWEKVVGKLRDFVCVKVCFLQEHYICLHFGHQVKSLATFFWDVEALCVQGYFFKHGGFFCGA